MRNQLKIDLQLKEEKNKIVKNVNLFTYIH